MLCRGVLQDSLFDFGDHQIPWILKRSCERVLKAFFRVCAITNDVFWVFGDQLEVRITKGGSVGHVLWRSFSLRNEGVVFTIGRSQFGRPVSESDFFWALFEFSESPSYRSTLVIKKSFQPSLRTAAIDEFYMYWKESFRISENKT